MIKGQAQRDLKMKTALRKENNKKYIYNTFQVKGRKFRDYGDKEKKGRGRKKTREK